MVYTKPGYTRSTFRKLPFGALFYLDVDTDLGPKVKNGRNTYMAGYGASTTIPDTSVAVVRVPNEYLGPA